jgi:hypothetical protein
MGKPSYTPELILEEVDTRESLALEPNMKKKPTRVRRPKISELKNVSGFDFRLKAEGPVETVSLLHKDRVYLAAEAPSRDVARKIATHLGKVLKSRDAIEKLGRVVCTILIPPVAPPPPPPSQPTNGNGNGHKKK